MIPTSTYTNHQLKCATHILIASVSKKSPTCHCEERSDVVAQPFARNERYGCGIPPAQPFATEERYGCGVPLAGIAGTIYASTLFKAVGRDDSARRCRNYGIRTNSFYV